MAEVNLFIKDKKIITSPISAIIRDKGELYKIATDVLFSYEKEFIVVLVVYVVVGVVG